MYRKRTFTVLLQILIAMFVTYVLFLLGACPMVRSHVLITQTFQTRDECVTNYGGPSGDALPTRSKGECAWQCSVDNTCQAFVYSPVTSGCWLYQQRTYCPSIGDCSRDLVYGERKQADPTGCVYNPTNEYRLCDGGSTDRGRVEVFHRGVWGTVCDDLHYNVLWDDQNALIVCRLFGYTNGTSVAHAEFGQGTGCILFDEVDCTGSEMSLFDCPRNILTVHDCGHHEDVGVVCT